LITSYIPSEIVQFPVYEIIPYPDENSNILTENIFDKYFLMKIKYLTQEKEKLYLMNV